MDLHTFATTSSIPRMGCSHKSRRQFRFAQSWLSMLASASLFQAAVGAEPTPVELSCGVLFSLASPQLYSMWPSMVPERMGGPEWDRMLNLQYAPFVLLKNTANRPVVLSGNPTVEFRQPKIGFKFKRIGSTYSGNITTAFVPADEMYAYGGSNKSYSMILYDQVVANQGTGSVSLAAGQSLLLSPYHNPSAPYSSRLDWNNNMTVNMKAKPGWVGAINGFSIDWLTGIAPLTPGLNSVFRIIPTRATDAWDVESTFTAAANGWRVFKPKVDGTPVLAPDSELEILQFPFKTSDFQDPAQVSQMAVNFYGAMINAPVHPIFSAIGPADSPSALAVLSDSDGNGLSDEWEMLHFAQLGVEPTDDADSDGDDNRFEFAAETSPIDGSDHFDQVLERQAEGGLMLTWSSIPGKSYTIERSDDLVFWSTFATKSGAAAPAETTTLDLGLPTSNSGYFRIRFNAPP